MKDNEIGVLLKMYLNDYARLLYKGRGFEVEEGYDFSKATHPEERQLWEHAKFSYSYWYDIINT